MTDDQKIEHLTGMLKRPEGKYTHDQIRAKLSELKASYDVPPASAPAAPPQATPKFVMNLGLGDREYPDDDSNVSRVVRGMGRMGDAIRGPAVALNKGVDTATFGLYSKLSNSLANATKDKLGLGPGGLRIGPTPEDYQKLQEERPLAYNTAVAAGVTNPLSLPAKVAGGVGRGIDLAIALARRRAGMQAATSGLGRVAGRVATEATKGAAANALIAGGETAIQGGTLDDVIRRSKDAAKFGAVFGAGAGALFGAGGEFARSRAASSPDIQKLGQYGYEPGPVPGRPVIRKDAPIVGQLPGVTEPPLGVSRVTPSTRAEASRVAVEEIKPDLRARRSANNQRFGDMQAKAYAAEGSVPVQVNHILTDISHHRQDASLPEATRTALDTLEKRILEFAQSRNGGTWLSAQKVDEIRDFADHLGNQAKAVKATDVPLRQAADLFRERLDKLAPKIAGVNKMQAEMLTGLEEREALLGLPASEPRGAKAREATTRAATKRVRQSGEESATGGEGISGGRSAAERLGDMGPPPVFPGGGGGLPPAPSYRSLLDVPRLQLAQENMQALPSKVFSGGGQGGPSTSLFGNISRFAGLIPDRLMYPIGRRLGERQVGSGVRATDELTDAIRQRREKKKKRQPAGAEQRK